MTRFVRDVLTCPLCVLDVCVVLMVFDLALVVYWFLSCCLCIALFALKVRSYCSVYGLRRQNKPVMEMCLARAAACFHPDNPDFDISKFRPSTSSTLQNRQQRKRPSSDGDTSLPAPSDSHSPSSPNASGMASAGTGLRSSGGMFHPQTVLGPSSVTAVPDSTHLGAGAGSYHMRGPNTVPTASQKRARLDDGESGAQGNAVGSSSRYDPSAHGHASHQALFVHPDKLGEVSAAAAGQIDVGVEATASANFFGPGQLLAPPSGPYDASARLAGAQHTAHLPLAAMQGHAGLPSEATTAANVAHINAITAMGGSGAPGLDGSAHGHGSGDFITREQAVELVRSSMEKVQMHMRDIIREEMTAWWNIVQDQRNMLERYQATIDSITGHH